VLTITSQHLRHWHGACYAMDMKKQLKSLFTIETKFQGFLVIYALALGATERGYIYTLQYPGWGGILLALCCTAAVFIAGGRLLDSIDQQAYWKA
jgi:hypothetical protein